MKGGVDPTDDELKRLAASGRDELLNSSVASLRLILNPSRLAAASKSSAPTLRKRLLAGPGLIGSAANDELWAPFARFISRRHRSLEGESAWRTVLLTAIAVTDDVWSGYRDGLSAVSEAFTMNQPSRPKIVAAIQANIDTQFVSKGTPVGWLLHAAAFTSSPRWKGTKPDKASQQLGAALNEVRRDHYLRITQDMSAFMGVAMDELRLRPQAGISAETVTILMHCLMDGAVLRMTIDPDALDSGLVAEAMVRLGEAFAIAGSIADPRRPAADADGSFDRIVSAAVEMWAGDEPLAPFEAICARAEVRVADARSLFPTSEALANSLLWLLVGGEESILPGPTWNGSGAFLRLALQRLIGASETHPRVIVHAGDLESPESDFFLTLHRAVEKAVSMLNPNTANPGEAARLLIAAAASGDAGSTRIDDLDTLLRLGL